MILPRQYYGSSCTSYGYGSNGYVCRSSGWSRFGRWILAGVLIFLAIFLLLVVVCLNRRRRARGGARFHPRLGMGGRSTKMQSQPAQSGPEVYGGGGGGMYNQNQSYAPPPGAPPPQYGGGTGGGANADYYGQTEGVAQPPNAYQPPYVK